MTTDEGMTTSVRSATEAGTKTGLTRRRKVMLIAGTTNAPVSKNQKSEINDPTALGWPSASPDALFCASPA
jgi:hypothetical protein